MHDGQDAEAEQQPKRKKRKVGEKQAGNTSQAKGTLKSYLKGASEDQSSNTVSKEEIPEQTPDALSTHYVSRDCVPSTPPARLLSHQREEGQDPILEDDIISPSRHSKKTPPRKMLKLNASGKLGSPKSATEDGPGPKKERRKGGQQPEARHLVAICRYNDTGDTQRIGNTIDRILSGLERHAKVDKVMQAHPQTKARTAKATHPFFTGKAAKGREDTIQNPGVATREQTQSPRKPSAATPGKIRTQVRHFRALQDSENALIRPFSQARAPQRVDRAAEAPWPSKETMHVRGYDSNSLRPPAMEPAPARVPPRKMKNRRVSADLPDDILTTCKQALDFTTKETTRSDGFSNPPLSLRIPERLLITGEEIQQHVKKHVSAKFKTKAEEESSADEIHRGPRKTPSAHPALRAIFDAIEHELTPYDEGRSEVLPWAQKYAPKTSDQVLQVGKESGILRDWMKALTVMTVESSLRGPKVDIDEHKPKKKRKKAKELNDFIVDSDEESMQMDELSDLEEDDSERIGSYGQKRTVVRSMVSTNGDPPKIANAVVISGPHGSGKTSMVYAVAKELDFGVFEINSGTRRSGKDVLERVGDMLGNHLVQHRAAESGNTSADEDATRLSDTVKKDLLSGRQGTMNSFFKPKPASAKPTKVPKMKKPNDLVKQATSGPKPARNQKQSLILLEEADVLFEEDKGFWTTVLTLIVNSKRPVIITCNDESLIPIQAMQLHAIMRLQCPPVNLSTDFLLLVAAKEGHLVSREAVRALLDYKSNDLRAGITELQFWCQMGIGDPRGGLGWMYQRWPPGTGIDENGRASRVVSKHSYRTGMGCLSYDPKPTLSSAIQEELLMESWRNWLSDPRDELHKSIELHYDVPNTGLDTAPKDRLAVLTQFTSLTDLLSNTDTCCRFDLPRSAEPLVVDRYNPLGGATSQDLLDLTLPDLSTKSRASYVEGLSLLQTDYPLDYTGFDAELVVTTSYLASQLYSNHPEPLLQIDQISLLNDIRHDRDDHDIPLPRQVFSAAFDIISEPPTSAAAPSLVGLAYSSFDGPLSAITMDIAPYVRSIVQFDRALEEQRTRLGSLLSSSGSSTNSKRGRTTRAAMSALEGGARQTTRRERWFPKSLDLDLVLKTGGNSWPKTTVLATESMAGASLRPSQVTSEAPSPEEMEE